MKNDSMTIGKVATMADVHVETIRYYQRLGLVSEPPRPPGGVRHYEHDTVARLRFIKRAQHLGFSLDEVRSLLALDDGQNCRETRALAESNATLIMEGASGPRLAVLLGCVALNTTILPVHPGVDH